MVKATSPEVSRPVPFLTLSKEAQRSLIRQQTYNFMIIKNPLNEKNEKIPMNVIQYYASTTDLSGDDKHQIFERL